MKKYALLSDGFASNISDDCILIRIGVWNHLEVLFEKKEFDNSNSNYELFKEIVKRLLLGEEISEEIFLNDKYISDIFAQLVAYRICKVIDDLDQQNKLKKKNVVYIVDDCILEQFLKISASEKNKYYKVNELDEKIRDSVLNKKQYLDYRQNIDEMCDLFKEYDYIKVIMSQMKINFLNKFNIVMHELKKSWTLGFKDGAFISIANFNSYFTGCFECISQNNIVRMANYINYLDYLKKEKSFSYFPLADETFFLIYSLINQIDAINFYDIKSPLEGKIISIYLPNFEINVENILKSPICTVCGHISKDISNDFNMSTANAMKLLIKKFEQGVQK